MKNKTSIFRSVGLVVMPIVIIAQLIVLSVAYKTVSNITYSNCKREIEKNAAVIEYIVAEYDLDDPEDVEECNRELNELCLKMDAPYIYALEVDEKAQTEKYLALGFGKDATEEAKKTRYSGVVVETELNQEIIDTLHHDCEDHLRQVNNKFGNSLICYRKIHTDSTNTRIIGVEKSIYDIIKDLNHVFLNILIMMLLFTVFIVFSFAYIVYRMVAKPARKISDKMSHYVSERSDKSEKYEKLEINGALEFNRMAESFNSMTDEISRYIFDIEALNREKHIQEAELNIARNIQHGLLSPEKFNDSSVSIRAFMQPAKEVGGDMYDYHIYENGDIYFAVADVSGKGISASLFMARAITLLQIFAQIGRSPSKTAVAFNDMLAKNNPKKLFITAFLAKYNPKTRKLTYTNVGHNPPYLISDKLVMLDDAHGMAAGIFSDVTYEETEITLKEGDTLFLYTDGVNEAENKNGEMFSTQRLERLLSEHINANSSDIVDDVRGKIKEFTNGALQSDDITMLALTVKNPGKKVLHLKSEVENLPQINDAIDSIEDLSFDDKWNLKLMAEEIFVNICSYSYPDSVGDVEFGIEISDDSKKVEMIFKDCGVQYDPTADILDIETYDHNNTVGGLGKYITFNTADSFSYCYENGKNILKLVKSVSRNQSES
ncbi:MAG: SpoIIE family protein phosphatase [Eubacterium sp.]|nr:SpoIIE family protein phosphatase [Eubacterium sp.]